VLKELANRLGLALDATLEVGATALQHVRI
jgi:hypothetical protein